MALSLDPYTFKNYQLPYVRNTSLYMELVFYLYMKAAPKPLASEVSELVQPLPGSHKLNI